MKILVVNGCVRKVSRTWEITTCFLDEVKKISQDVEIEILNLKDMNLQYFNEERLETRSKAVLEGDFDHPILSHAKNFVDADKIVIAAPFWDLEIPAIVKVYLENVCVEKVTFYADKTGMHGLCKANNLLYITTRGGKYQDSNLDIASKYLSALCEFFGIENFSSISAEGIDIFGMDVEKILNEAKKEAAAIAEEFLK